MRQWRVTQLGEPEQMVLMAVPNPEPGPRQVRIRNAAASLNFLDLLQVRGQYQVKPALPFSPGAEVAGIVDQVGSEVRGFALGDRVVAVTLGGGFGELALADERWVFPIPAEMAFTEAASLPVVYHTALFALRDRGHLRRGEWLLIHAGASGTGSAAIQVGRALGARVIATAGSGAKLDFCREQGAQFAFDHRSAVWPDQVREATGGGGADVVFDPVGGDAFDGGVKCLAPGGRMLVIGFASGAIPSIGANRILLKNIAVIGAMWGNYVAGRPEYVRDMQQELLGMYRAGEIRPAIGAVYEFGELPRALRDLAERRVVGKAVLRIGMGAGPVQGPAPDPG